MLPLTFVLVKSKKNKQTKKKKQKKKQQQELFGIENGYV